MMNYLEHMSYSSISLYMRCPTQWYFRYVEGLKIPPAVSMVQGTAVHTAAEVNYRQKLNTYEDEDLATVLDVAHDTFVSGTEECDWQAEEVDPAVALDETIGLTKVWHRDLAPLVQPVDVERKVEVSDPTWPVPLIGYVDVETEDRIIDLKTAGKKKAQADLERDVQSGIYLLEGHKRFSAQSFTWHVAIKTKTPASQVLTRETFDAQRITRLVAHEEKAILASLQSGIFGAALPDAWWCSERMCGYWHVCEWGGKGAAGIDRALAPDIRSGPIRVLVDGADERGGAD